jgi:hypothetical protein
MKRTMVGEQKKKVCSAADEVAKKKIDEVGKL